MSKLALGRCRFLASLLILLSAGAARATVPSDLCTGDPCNVTGSKTVDADSVLDFPPGTDLVFKTGSVVTLAAGVVPPVGAAQRTMTIRADTITMEPNARLVALPIPDGPNAWGYAFVTLEATQGDLVMQSSGTLVSKIEGQGNWATDVSLTAAGNVTINGSVLNKGTGVDSFGGDVLLTAGGAIAVTTDLLTTASGENGWGGAIAMDAGGDVSVDGVLDATGGGFGGGAIDLSSTSGTITAAQRVESGAGAGGDSGGVSMESSGDLTASIVRTSASVTGGDISLSSANGDILVNGSIESNAGADGAAGAIDLEAPTGDVTVVGTITGNGSELEDFCGDGSALTIAAGGALTLMDDVTVRGGQFCTGGAIDIATGTDFVPAAGAAITASAPGLDSSGGSFTLFAGRNATLRNIDLGGVGWGGAIEATAAGTLSAQGPINLQATEPTGVGGSAVLTACTLSVAATGSVDVRGDDNDSGIDLVAREQMTIATGAALRSDYHVHLIYRELPPIVGAGVTILPAREDILDPSLAPCSTGCGDGTLESPEVCDDDNNLSCDGCAADCSRVDDVCGDGIRECGEQCDDGNTTSGDGCNADCTLPAAADLLVQGSPQSQGCQAEWKLHMSNGQLGSTGLPTRTQKCTDNDPACDHDGLNDLRCSYEAQVCLRVTDPRLPACQPAALDWIRISNPSPYSDDPIKAQNGQAILDALEPLGLPIYVLTTLVQPGVPFASIDQCTDSFTMVVPRAQNGTGKKTFNIVAQDVDGDRMQANSLTLTCGVNTAVCGNHLVESFEQCDDGNTAACDGCSPGCHSEVCGNGTLDCGEQCDEGAANGTPGNRCSATCTEVPPALRIPGGGSKFDCAYEWSAELAAGSLLTNKAGIPRNSQRCTDGDPSCDFDPAPGNCKLRLWACLGGADARIACSAAQVTTAGVTSPRVTAIGSQLAARNAVLAAFSALDLPAGPGEECTGQIEVNVPTGKSLHLVTSSTLSTGKRDSDTLTLSCKAP